MFESLEIVGKKQSLFRSMREFDNLKTIYDWQQPGEYNGDVGVLFRMMYGYSSKALTQGRNKIPWGPGAGGIGEAHKPKSS